MSALVSEKVFEKKHTKLKALGLWTLRYSVYLAFIFLFLLMYAYNKRFEDPLTFTRNYWLLFVAVAVIGVLSKMIRQKDINVTVLSKTVDITVGDENNVFQVKDYVGPDISRVGKKNDRYGLIFAEGGDSSDGKRHITLPGVKLKELKEISDAVMTAKQELAGGVEYEAFEGEVYESKRRSSVDLKFGFLAAASIAVTVLIIVQVLGYFLSSDIVLGLLVSHLIVLLPVFIIVLANFIRYSLEKEPAAKALRTLTFESTGYKINDKSYLYNEIESVTMTPPYVTDFPYYHRILSVKTYEAKKPVRYSLGNRIGENETEEEIATDCTCAYPALYERIKNDKALNRKFKI